MFVETYEYSKRIEGIREYLRHVEFSKNFDKRNLAEIKQKVDELPRQFIYEKEEFNKKINTLMNIIPMQKNANEKLRGQKEFRNETKIKLDEEKLKNSQSITIGQIGSEKQKQMLYEIERLYSEFKSTNDSQRVQNLYKKITFYLNLAHLHPDMKRDIIKKLNKTLHEKKLN